MTRKRKRLSQREKDENARIKKELQAKGILPPDKPRLKRRKFAADVLKEWDDFKSKYSTECDIYLCMAATCMVRGTDKITSEQIGILKSMKIAIETKKFKDELIAEGRTEYTIREYMERVVLPIIKL